MYLKSFFVVMINILIAFIILHQEIQKKKTKKS